MRGKQGSGGGSGRKSESSWLAGAAIGLTLLSMASGAMALGVGLALTRPPVRGS